MIRILKKQIALLFIVINICTVSGCSGYREVDKLGIAAGIAIDFNEYGDKYVVTVEMIEVGASENTKSTISKFYTTTGDSVFDAVRLLIIKTGRRIFWSHSVVILVGEEVAQKGMVPVLDWVSRDTEPRADMNLIITKGCTAKDLLICRSEPNDMSSFHLNDIMKSQKILSKMASATVWEFVNDISSGLTQPTAPAAQLYTTEGETEQDIYGTAIFKKDKVVGYINRDESFYLYMIKDKLKEGIIVVKDAVGTNTTISFEVFHNKTTLTPIYENEKMIMKVDVKTVVAIDEVSGTDDLVVNEEGRDKLKKQTEEIVTKNLLDLIIKMQQEYNTDILGFTSTMKIKSPNIWRKLEHNKNEVFQNIIPEINVQIIIKGSGTNSKPIKIGSNTLNGRVGNVYYNNCYICLNNIYRTSNLT